VVAPEVIVAVAAQRHAVHLCAGADGDDGHRAVGATLTAQTGMVGPMSTILMGVLLLGEPFNAWIAPARCWSWAACGCSAARGHSPPGAPNMIRDRLLAILLLCASGAASADTVRYDFQNYNGNILAPASGPAHLQASPVSVSGPGICWNTSLATTNDFACGGFGSSTVSFIVTPDAGWVFDVLGFSFQGLGTDPEYGPTGFGVYSSLDGFGSALISGSLVGQVTDQRYDYDAGLGPPAWADRWNCAWCPPGAMPA
jgi:hypothetical protein